MNIIETIRAEVERRIENLSYTNDFTAKSIIEVLDDILIFLDTLQEQPVCEDLEKEIERYLSTEWELDEDLNKNEPIYIYDCAWEDLKVLARHFAQWQKEQMEERWLKDRDGCFWDGVNEGKKSMKEQMMKEAVEAKIYGYDDGSFELVASWLDMPKESKFKDGDKVCIVIVKEEGK